MTSQHPKTLVNFYRTGPMPCPYRPGQIERNLFAELGGPAGAAASFELHDRLTKAGFRRSHTVVYRPACPKCTACIPVRVRVADFQMSRSLKRIRNRNRHLEIRIIAPDPTPEHFALFGRYQRHRHAGGDMAAMSYADYRAMVDDTIGRTRLVEFRDADRRLIAACLTDYLKDGLSAVYSFFDPELDGDSLGTFIVLSLIDCAARSELAHVYLGYWIEDSPKMSYKMRFRPLEALGPDGWKVLEPTQDYHLD
ncbi:MAG: arginyltransferase [Alphaproteobacteria bacterium]|nr:arginyltransferase [Alphaproteobacteria bacterium]